MFMNQENINVRIKIWKRNSERTTINSLHCIAHFDKDSIYKSLLYIIINISNEVKEKILFRSKVNL